MGSVAGVVGEAQRGTEDHPQRSGAAPDAGQARQKLHLGVANYCWFTDPSKALCLRLAGTPTADRPLIGMCDSARCPQATHHPCHRPAWEQAVTSTTVFLGNLGRGQKTERTRLETQLDRAQRVLAALDAASGPAGSNAETT
jgi:hypothetical protein